MRFIESILFKDGEYQNLEYHQQRVDRTFEKFMPSIPSHDLKNILLDLKMDGIYKARLVYEGDAEDADYDLEFIEYKPKLIRSIALIETDSFDYSFKYENRSKINSLLSQADTDEIIISINGFITDSSYSNLAFWNGEKWLTPAIPLLNGVRRTQLIHERKIHEAPIKNGDLSAFEKVSLINAMLDLEDMVIPIDHIK